MKPLPEMDIIPPFSAENKEADVDRDKRKMLTNNVNMIYIHIQDLLFSKDWSYFRII